MSSLLAINDIHIGTRHRREVGDLCSLADSIAILGLLHPIVVDGQNRLVAGFRRLRALELLGREEVPITVVHDINDAKALLAAERDENTCRKALDATEEYTLGIAMEQIERPGAEHRKQEGRKRGGKARHGQLAGQLTPEADETQRVSAKVAAALGRSRKNWEQLKAVMESGEARLIEELRRRNRVAGVYRRMRRLRQAAAIAQEPPPMPGGPFRVIVADPPWMYGSRADDASHRSANPYPSMTIEQICELPVRERAEHDAILWLWTTNAHLPEAFRVVESWGFTYKTMLTWVKNKIGTGDWLRGQTEHCLLCVRGRPVMHPSAQAASTVLHADMGRHSEKPEAFFRLVESTCPGSKLELFSRRPREGWAAFGDELAVGARGDASAGADPLPLPTRERQDATP